MMQRLSLVLMVGMLGIGAAQTPAPQAVIAPKMDATPAMWKVKGVHGTVYLFGSVHVMKPDVVWETAKVRDALKSSDTLYLEIAEIDDPAMATKLQPLIMQSGIDMAHPLSGKISAEDKGLLDAAVTSLGLPGGPDMVQMMQPWLVSLTLSMAPVIKAGYKPDSGIDMKILAEAKSETKAVKGFETSEQQLQFLSGMPQAEQVQQLHQTLIDLPKGERDLNEMVADWTRGDVDKIAAMENDEMKVKSPELYKTMLVERNVHFAEVIDGVLNDPKTGTVFVTIGAAHLAGPDSVVKDLEAKGFKVERVE